MILSLCSPSETINRMTHLKKQIEVCVFIEINFLGEVAKSFQRRIANSVHLRLGIRFQPTDEVAQHRKMRQTANATALDDLCTKAIPNLQEPLRIP